MGLNGKTHSNSEGRQKTDELPWGPKKDPNGVLEKPETPKGTDNKSPSKKPARSLSWPKDQERGGPARQKTLISNCSRQSPQKKTVVPLPSAKVAWCDLHPHQGTGRYPSLPPGDVGEGRQSRSQHFIPVGSPCRGHVEGLDFLLAIMSVPLTPSALPMGWLRGSLVDSQDFPPPFNRNAWCLSRSSHLQSPLHPMQVERMWWGARGGGKDTRELSSHPCPAEHILGHKSYRQWCSLTTMHSH